MTFDNAYSGVTPRVLPALNIPVIDITGNAGLGNTDLADPQKSVALFAYILFSTVVDDFVELFWNNRVVQNFRVTDAHLKSGVISFSVLPIDIPDSPPDSEVYYRITTVTGGNQDESPKRSIRVKRSIPGDPDPNNTTPTINENLQPPEGVPEVIETAVDLVLTIAPWPIMRVGDVLTLYWGGRQYPFRNPPLTQAQLDQPQTVEVDAATLVAAGDSASLIVNYEIRDEVNNWSLYSSPAFTDVQIDPNAPGAPRVVDADPTTHEIDLAVLGSKDVQVLIPPRGLNPLDIITLHWIGQTSEGTPVEPVIAPKPVDADGFTPEFEVLNADVVAIASGSARVYYNVQPAVGPGRSKSVTVSVVGQPAQLDPPTLDGAVGNTIDPEAVPATGATVRIKPYTAKDFGDVVILLWEGLDAVNTPLVYSDEYSVGRNEENIDVTFPVPKNKLEPLVNGSLTLSYTVKYISGNTRSSPTNTYQVLGNALLPMPTVDNAPGDVFDPDQFNGTVVHVDGAAAALKHSDQVTVFWTGLPAGSASRDFLVNSDNQNLSWPITTALIEPNRNNQVRVRYAVVRSTGGPPNSEVRVITIRGAGPVSGWESFEEQALFVLPLNTAVAFNNNLKITVTAATAVTAVVVPPPELIQFADRALRCAANNVIKFDFGGTIENFKISHAQTSTSQSILEFFDAAGTRVYTYPLVPPAGGLVRYENISLRPPRSCTYCVLTVDNAGLLVDNFIWN